jgi:hypothetical protein
MLFRIIISRIIHCPKVCPVAAYVFFFVLIFLLYLYWCVTSVCLIVPPITYSSQRSTCCFVFQISVKSLVKKCSQVAAYVFFFVLTFLLSFLQCDMTGQSMDRSKASSSRDWCVASYLNFQNSPLSKMLFTRCLRLLLRPQFYSFLHCVTSV